MKEISETQAQELLAVLMSSDFEEFEKGLLTDYIEGDFDDHDDCRAEVLKEIKLLFRNINRESSYYKEGPRHSTNTPTVEMNQQYYKDLKNNIRYKASDWRKDDTPAVESDPQWYEDLKNNIR